MRDWIERLNAFLMFNERGILTNSGKVSHALAEKHAIAEFQKYEANRLSQEAAQPTEYDRLAEEVNRVKNALPSPKSKKKKKKENDETT